MKDVKIIATGFAVPEHVVTNDDLSKILDTSDEWIVKRTGIKRRYVLTFQRLVQAFLMLLALLEA